MQDYLANACKLPKRFTKDWELFKYGSHKELHLLAQPLNNNIQSYKFNITIILHYHLLSLTILLTIHSTETLTLEEKEHREGTNTGRG